MDLSLGESVPTIPSADTGIHHDVYEHDTNLNMHWQDTTVMLVESFNGCGTLLRCSRLKSVILLTHIVGNNVDLSGESVSSIPPLAADVCVYKHDTIHTNMHDTSPFESFTAMLNCGNESIGQSFIVLNANFIFQNSLFQSVTVCSQKRQSIMTMAIAPLTVPVPPFPPILWLTAWTRSLRMASILALMKLISKIWAPILTWTT